MSTEIEAIKDVDVEVETLEAITVRMPKSQMDQLKIFAEKRNIKTAVLMRKIVDTWIKQETENNNPQKHFDAIYAQLSAHETRLAGLQNAAQNTTQSAAHNKLADLVNTIISDFDNYKNDFEKYKTDTQNSMKKKFVVFSKLLYATVVQICRLGTFKTETQAAFDKIKAEAEIAFGITPAPTSAPASKVETPVAPAPKQSRYPRPGMTREEKKAYDDQKRAEEEAACQRRVFPPGWNMPKTPQAEPPATLPPPKKTFREQVAWVINELLDDPRDTKRK